jgi:molybdopterin molybdotransferase
MIEVFDARQELLKQLQPVEKEQVTIRKPVGRVLGEPILATSSSPSFNNSGMDGFAVISKDVVSANAEKPVVLEVVADIPAGKCVETELLTGQAMRIMTGAPLPPGSDAVVPSEHTNHSVRVGNTSLPSEVKIYNPAYEGENIRFQGEDFSIGDKLLEKGQRLRPQDVGILAMIGKTEFLVFRKPKIGLISTGNELLPVESILQPGKIRETNSHTLSPLVESCGGEVENVGIVPDGENDIRDALDNLIKSKVDLIVSSAGVSVGIFDFVRKVVEDYGQLKFWRVNMRPGKPLAVGSFRNVPFVGLPGNPVSAFVSFEVFLRPAINHLAGVSNWQRKTARAVLLDPVESDGRESYHRAILKLQEGTYFARLTGHQGSGNLFSLVLSNGLIIVPAGVKSLKAGAEVEVWPLS